MQRGNLVVELLAALVEAARAVGQHLGQRHIVDHAVAGHIGGDFEQGQGAAHITIGGLGDHAERGLGNSQLQCTESALGIAQRALERSDDRLDRHRIHHMHAATREQRRIQLERWILRRRSDEQNDAFLDMRQKRILLRLVETMHLVDEQHAALALGKTDLSVGERSADIGQARQHCRNRLETRVRIFREQQRQRGLAAAWRSPQHHRMHVPGLDASAQRCTRPEQTRLPDDFIERLRTHAFGQRLQALLLGEKLGSRLRFARCHARIIRDAFDADVWPSIRRRRSLRYDDPSCPAPKPPPSFGVCTNQSCGRCFAAATISMICVMTRPLD